MTPIHHRVRNALTAPIALIGAVSALALAPSPAAAEIGPEFTSFGEYGSGAGQLDFTTRAGGIATDPDTGHVFVGERGNRRISEFTAWGEFVKAWGWGVRDGSPELQTCTETTGCQKGLAGPGAGQVSSPAGIAIDPSGDVFVFEYSIETSGKRIQKFSAAGEFLWMVGGEVNKTSGADICTQADLEGGDVCGAGVPGSGPGEFSITAAVLGDLIDVGPDDRLYVADSDRVQYFDLDGAYEGELSFATIHASNPLFPEDPDPAGGSLAIDPLSGDLVLAFSSSGSCCGPSSAWRITPAGSVLDPAPMFSSFPSPGVPAWTDAVAADSAGSAYFSVDPADTRPGRSFSREYEPRVVQLDATGTQTGECCLSPPLPQNTRDEISALASNTVTGAGGTALYVVHRVHFEGTVLATFIEALGTPPDKWPPPPAPPEIAAQYAHTVGAESAVLKAEVNPNFWADTAYQLQLGTEDCSTGECDDFLPAPRQLGAGVVKRDVTSDGVVISGLQPATTYHYRFVAESSGDEDPVHGPDKTFTTFAAPKQTSAACPNQALRFGPSASLADCRAYEMVSPLDKGGADISVFIQLNGYLARLDQAAASGQKVTYSASTAFGDAPGGAYSSQYLSTRGGSGWSTQAITPARDSGSFYATMGIDSPFKAFTEDLSSGWLLHDSEPTLAPGAIEGFGNLYRRDNLSGSYEALATAEPPGVDPPSFIPTLLGFSADGSRAFFRARGQLTSNASANSTIEQVYEAHKGQLRLVSVRSNGTPAPVSSTAGAREGSLLPINRFLNVDTAVSEDGRLVYWTEEDPKATKLYLRVEGAETIAVSGSAEATFQRASSDGERMLYTEGGALKRFEYSTRESSTLVAGGVVGVMGASEDLSRIYFASKEVLDAGAVAEEPNLYLLEDGQELRFIATLGSEEARGLSSAFGGIPSLALSPLYRLSRVTPDGQVALFMSNRALSGAESLERDSGEPVAEVFRYDAGADELRCLSCLPTGARPAGVEMQFGFEQFSGYHYASKIPGYEMQFHAPRVLSADGSRAFFDSVNRLTLADTNGRSDVYQWEAEGKGECEGEGSPGHDPKSGGCLTLISDGKGSTEAEFIDASEDGTDVFFFTGTSLLPQDIGQIDVYDARAGGGFPQPPAPAAQCEGEACQAPVSPPAEPSYASQGYQGPGNPKAAAKKAKKKQQAKRKKAKRKRQGSRAKSRKAKGKAQRNRRGGRR